MCNAGQINVPANSENGAMAMVGTARGDRRADRNRIQAPPSISHTRDGMSNYKKASSETNVEVADGNILPVDWFGRIPVDLDQPRSTTMMVRMDDVAYVPGRSSRQWNNVENRLFTTG